MTGLMKAQIYHAPKEYFCEAFERNATGSFPFLFIIEGILQEVFRKALGKSKAPNDSSIG